MTRMRTRRDEAGFTLIELLVVMIIIAILAAIAIPVIIDQRRKAQDTATRSDAARLGKLVTGWYFEYTTPPTIAITGGRFLIGTDDQGKVSPGVAFGGGNAASLDTSAWTRSAWCFTLTNPDGQTDIRFSAQQGLENGTCSSATAP